MSLERASLTSSLIGMMDTPNQNGSRPKPKPTPPPPPVRRLQCPDPVESLNWLAKNMQLTWVGNVLQSNNNDNNSNNNNNNNHEDNTVTLSSSSSPESEKQFSPILGDGESLFSSEELDKVLSIVFTIYII